MFSNNNAPNPYEVLNTWRREFQLRQAAGTIRPLVLPYQFYGVFLLVLYLLIPHTQRPWVYAARWPVFLVILAFHVKLILQTSSMDMGTGFGAGMVAVYFTMWSATWLLLNRPQYDAKRIEWTAKRKGRSKTSSEASANGTITTGHQVADSTLRKRGYANGNTRNGEKEAAGAVESDGEYFWQSYPEDFKARLPWVLDLVGTQRGERWNWAIATLPPLPCSVKLSLGEPVSDAEVKAAENHARLTSSVGIHAFSSPNEAFWHHLPRIVLGYFALDFIKTCMMNDPYFWLGPNSYNLPPHLSDLSPSIVRLSRQLLSFSAIIVALETGFMLRTVLFCMASFVPGVSSRLGVRGEAWMHPTQWGSFSPILRKGLNGLWGGWWHQTFRFAFAAPTNYLTRNNIIAPRSATARAVGLFFAFAISGMIHAGGSITQYPPTKPWYPPVFFTLQAVGILLQETFSTIFQPQLSRLPSSARKAGNVLFTFGWLKLTGDWLIDDFARGGLWLFEPIPISPLRGLGWGPEGSGWWCWPYIGTRWYTGEHWWESGVAFGAVPTKEMLGGWRESLGKFAGF